MGKRIDLFFAGRGKPSPSAAKGPVLLALIMVGVTMILEPSVAFGRQPLSIAGITEPLEDITLNAIVEGTIAKLHFKEGATVKKGQILLEMDKQLETLEVGRRKLLWESKAKLEAASAQAATLKSLLASTRELFESTRSVSKDELIRLELEYKLAVSEKQRLEVAEVREKIEYEMALETLARRSLRAPIPGTIIKLFLDIGESCEQTQPLVHLVNTRKCLFVCNIEEWAGRTLKKGQSVDLKIKIGSDAVDKKGKVIFASPVVDPASGLLEVKAEFDNADGAVRPGISGVLILNVP
jgi:RND family efflux transporter MFP subunit